MDQIIEKVGSFGRYQALLFSSATLAITVTVWSMIFMAFGNYNPGWSCEDNIDGVDDGNPTANVAATALSNSSLGGIIKQNTTTPTTTNVMTCEMWAACGKGFYDTDSSSTIVTEWNLLCDRAWILSIIITVQMSGVLVGACVCGPVGERLGRKVSLFSNLALMAVSNLVCAFSTSWEMFAAVRFFVGFSAGGVLPTAFVYPLEFVGQWWRPVLCSVPSWSFGTVTFALVSFVFKDWRNMHFATAVVSGACFLPVFWVPESMRWLAVNNRVDQFKTLVKRISAWNKKEQVNPDLIDYTIKQIVVAQKQEKKTSYLNLFKTKKLSKYSLKFGFIWVIMSLAYFTISFSVKSFSGNFYLNLVIFGLVEMLPTAFVGPLSNKFGRRFTSGLFLGLAAVAAFGVVLLKLVPGIDNAVVIVALATISNMAIVTCWKPISLMSAELYPTVVRNLQSGYLNSLARIGGILSAYIIPADESKIFITYTVIGILLLLSVLAVCSVSETKGKAMTDVINERVNQDTETDVCLTNFHKCNEGLRV